MNKNILLVAGLVVLVVISVSLFMQKKEVITPAAYTVTAAYSNGTSRVEAEFDNSDETVTFTQSETGTVTLARVSSGSGARYANDDESIVFWEHQNEVTITKDGKEVFVGTKDEGQVEAESQVGQSQESSTAPATNQKISIAWKFEDAGDIDNIPNTDVTVVINNIPHEVGRFQGSCSEIGASGGIDGKGLLVGELAAAQCWFAGGGDEIGVFAHEDGGVDVMTGGLSEGVEGGAFFRGDFSIKQTIQF